MMDIEFDYNFCETKDKKPKPKYVFDIHKLHICPFITITDIQCTEFKTYYPKYNQNTTLTNCTIQQH